MSAKNTTVVFLLVFLVILLSPVFAATYYVEQNHPQASDDNPGSEDRPWLTIKHSAEVADAGDTVLIKAGHYREGGILVQNSGRLLLRDPQSGWLPNHPLGLQNVAGIVFRAFGDGEVVLDGSVIVPAAAWQRVDGTEKVYVAAVQANDITDQRGGRAPQPIRWVFFNDQYLLPNVTQAGPGGHGSRPEMRIPTDEDVNRWHEDQDNGLLYVNVGGGNPAEVGKLEVSVWSRGFQGHFQNFITLQGVTLQRYGERAVDMSYSMGNVISDCLLRHCHTGINGCDDGVIRRNTVIEADRVGITPGTKCLVEDNLVIRNFRDTFQSRNGYQSTAITFFGGENRVFRNNVVLESGGNGFWPDVWGPGHMYYGNVTGRCKSNGFYIEAPMYNNFLTHNVCFDNRNGITLRMNANNLITHNYIYGSSTGITIYYTEHLPVFMRNNNVTNNYLRDLRVGIGIGQPAEGGDQVYNFADRNYYDPSVKFPAVWAGETYETLEAFQEATGNEPHGRAQALPYEEMELVTFRVMESSKPWEAVPMFGNPTAMWPDWGNDAYQPYFWRYGTASSDEQVRWYLSLFTWGVGPVSPMNGEGGFVRWPWQPPHGPDPGQAGEAPGYNLQPDRSNRCMIQVASLREQVVSAEGLGWWTPSLPTAPGAIVDVGLYARLDEVEATEPAGGLTVFVEWSNYTRVQVAHGFIVGRDDQGQNHRADMMTGTFDYTRLEGTVTAPDWARRCRLFLGLRSCTGAAAFDDIDTIKTRPGIVPTEQKVGEQPLVDPATLNFVTVDLSELVNRALIDEVADDGQGGWTDQGALADMSALGTGRKEYEGVPFLILAPKSVVVLDSPVRPQSQLPKQVTIAVGSRADVLYFLHSGAWVSEGDGQFTYVIKYADGSQEQIEMVGGKNLADWSLGRRASFPRLEGQRASIATTVGTTMFPEVNVYMLEWLNPQPQAEIESIDFLNAGTGVPLLLAITGGVSK